MSTHPHNLPAQAGPDTGTAIEIIPSATAQPRHDGWTAEKQGVFLRALASSHCVATAARAAGMSRQSAYRLRNRLRGEPFDVAWHCAFRRQNDALGQAALERALNGVEVPHFYKGELIHTSRRYDERLTVALLALRQGLTRIGPDIHAEQQLFHPDNFEALVERVETGDELWEEAADDDDGGF